MKNETRVFGDQERVTVDGELGTVVGQGEVRDSYLVRLDASEETVERMAATIKPLPEGKDGAK